MAYEIISQNNNTTTLSDGTNTITVPARVTLATSTSYTISEVNNNTATLEGSDGSVIRDVPCVVVLAGEGGGSSYTAGTGIDITEDVISVTSPTLTNTATESTSLGIKNYGSLTNAYSVVAGYNSRTTGDDSVVVGAGAKAGNYGTSIGAYANAVETIADRTTSIGYGSKATAAYSVGVGPYSCATNTGAIQLGYGTNNTVGTLSVGLVSAENPRVAENYELLSSDGNIPVGRLGNAIVKYSIMPTAGAEHANKIVQYTGGTNASYTKGYFYQGKVSATPSTASISQTTGTSLANLTVDKSTFETAVSHTTGNYAFTSDGTNWSYDGNTVDLTDYGITYTGTPVADDVITVVYYAPVYLYYWEQINVQPQAGGLPSQTGQSGKFLTTDGTDASWSDKPLVNISTGYNGFVVGTSSYTTSYEGFSIGLNAQSRSTRSMAIGGGSVANGDASTAVGRASNSGAYKTSAFGDGAAANSSNCIAIGSSTLAGTVGSSVYGAIQIGNEGSNQESGTLCIALTTSNTYGHSTNYKLLDSDGTIPADRLPNAINKYSTMPTAASTNEGWIVQFTGTTDSTYTHGYIYECKAQGTDPETYAWEAVSVQAGGGGGLPSQTGNSGKFLTTDGTDASWSDKPLVNTANDPTQQVGILGTVASYDAYGIAIGAGATQIGRNRGVAIGYNAKVGLNALSGGSSVAIGNAAEAKTDGYSIAIGSLAQSTAYGAIQIGCGTNSNNATLCVGLRTSATSTNNYQLLASDGTIPTDRFTTTPVADGTYVPTLIISSGVATRSWAAPSGGGSTALSLTLAAANWSNNTITVTATGVTASNNVIVSPAPASQSAYTTAGVMCTGQAADSLTFTCTTAPSSDLTVTVLII